MNQSKISKASIISLLDDPEITLATSKRVFTKEESGALFSMAETVSRIRILEDNRTASVEKSKSEAALQGYEDGLKRGRQEARQELSDKLLELEKSSALHQQNIREDVVAIALQVVRKIAASVAPEELLVALAEGAAAEHLPPQSVALKVHPEHLDAVKIRIQELKSTGSIAIIESVVADNELELTDCILETSAGQICADLETQLVVFEQHLSVEPVSSASVAAQ